MNELLLFYEEPNRDRWVRFDRYPRQLIRRLVRGVGRPTGHKMVFLNLLEGLQRLRVPLRVNDYRYARRNPERLACIVGKAHVLLEREWANPILFGASVFSHPLDCPDLFERYDVRRMLVPGEWMRRMSEPYYGDRVRTWAVGVDTDEWSPRPTTKSVDVLIYDKIYWQRGRYESELLDPIRRMLSERGLTSAEIRYGEYQPEELKDALARSRAVITFSRHETQGIAYLEMLASGVPIFAWDEGGFWQDPEYYPARVKFEPVTSVPYFDARCGRTFRDAEGFAAGFDAFWADVRQGAFAPREFVLESLTLEHAARAYVRHVEECGG